MTMDTLGLSSLLILITLSAFSMFLFEVITSLGDTKGSEASVKDDFMLKSGVDSLEYAPESYSEITESDDE